jgi:hypothetical protein
MEKKMVILVLAVALALLAPSFAGMGISPGAGNYNFTKQGGTLQVVISNLNAGDRQFKIVLEEGFSGNRFLSKGIPSDLISVTGNDFKVINLLIKPDDTVEYGKPYLLAIRAIDATGSAGGSAGIGASGVESASASYYIIFENKGTTVSYGGFDEGATRAHFDELNAKKKFNIIPILIAFLIVAAILSVLTWFIAKRRKESEKDEIVVQRQPVQPQQPQQPQQ